MQKFVKEICGAELPIVNDAQPLSAARDPDRSEQAS
jgi:hypothetical protein